MKYALLMLQNSILDLKSVCQKKLQVVDCLVCLRRGGCSLFNGPVPDFWTLSELEDFELVKKAIKAIKNETRAIALIDIPDDTMYMYQATGDFKETVSLCIQMYEAYKKESVMLKVTDLRGVPIDPEGLLN